MHIQRLLILASEDLADIAELPPGVHTLVDSADEVFVVSPTQPSRLHWLFTDIEGARHHADERLTSLLGKLHAAGIHADGQVGADSPFTAISDAIRQFHPDHIVCAIRRDEHADWHLMERTERDFGVPMTMFELDAAGHPTQA